MSTKESIKNLLRSVRLQLIKVCAKNRFLGRIYFLFSGDFDRESEFVLLGRVEALSSRYLASHSNSNLRRCIHRLEKGLFHRDRRAKFGGSVLSELLRELPALRKMSPIDPEEKRWALDTLNEYKPFSLKPEQVDLCLTTIEAIPSMGFEAEEVVPSTLETARYTDLATLFRERESVRFFNGTVPDTSLLNAAVSIAKEAPSACNREPFHLHILQDPKDIQFVGGLAPGTSGFLDNIPTLGVLVGHASAFRFARDRHLIYLDGGLFLGHFLPALTSLNLSSCVLNWTPHYKNDRAAIDYLGLDFSKTVVCLIAIGFRDTPKSPISTKKSNGNLLRQPN